MIQAQAVRNGANTQPDLPLGFPEPRRLKSLWVQPAAMTPPSGAVVAAVLQFGDLREEREDGAILIRFSRARLDREDMRLLLGDEAERAFDISVLWDEAQAEMLEVLDAGPLRTASRSGRTGNAYADARLRGTPGGRPLRHVLDHAEAA